MSLMENVDILTASFPKDVKQKIKEMREVIFQEIRICVFS